MIKFLIFFTCAICVSADVCSSPSVSSSYYSSSNQKLSTDTVFVVEFDVKCSNKLENLQLYAAVDGMHFPVTRSPEGNKYQVSWVVKGKKTTKRSYDVRFFDEEGYNNLRKVRRSGQDESSVKPLFVVDINHPGLSAGFWIQSELLALAVAAFAFYLVCQERSAVIA